MRQSQRMPSLLLAAVVGIGISGAAIAQLPVRGAANSSVVISAAAAAGVPSNSVDCVYTMMSPEDREMALLLLEREAASDVKSHSGSRNLKVLARLMDEARAKCSAPYKWSSVSSDAAMGYAMNVLMSTGLSQTLEAKGQKTEQIDEYYAKHRTDLAGIENITGTKADEFKNYLNQSGWVKSDPSLLRLANYYLEALIAREQPNQTFAAASGSRVYRRN